MADGTQFVNVTQTGGTPEDYLVSGAASIDLLAVRADFDGSGAGGDFLPVLQILNAAGQVELTFPGPFTAAGDSVSVTFAPFLRGAGSGAPGVGDIRFDFANVGGALSIQTNNSGFSTTGFFLDDQSTHGIIIRQDANGPILVQGTGDGKVTVEAEGAGLLSVRQVGDGGMLIEDDGSGGISIKDTGPGGIAIRATNGDTNIDVAGTNELTIVGLPLLNPGGSGRVWNDAGVLKIT